MRKFLLLIVLLTICNFNYAQIIGNWSQNGTNLHNQEEYTTPTIKYSDSMNLYYILAADSTSPSNYRVDTTSVLGGTWGLLDSSFVADDFIILDNGDLIFTRFQNGIMEIEATDPLGQSIWTSSPSGQPYSGIGYYSLDIYKGLNDDVYVSIVNDGNYNTYRYANQTWDVIGTFYTPKIEFLSNGDPVIGGYVSDMTPGNESITYFFDRYDGNNWVLLDSVQFTQQIINGFDFCVSKYDSIYAIHSVLDFIAPEARVFRVSNFSATQIGIISGSTDVYGLHIISDLLGDIHAFCIAFDLGWEGLNHRAFDAQTYSTFGGGSLLIGEQGTLDLSLTNSPIATCVDETNCVGFAVAQHTDHFQNNGPDSIRVNTKKFCSCKFTDLQNTISEQNNTLYATNLDFAAYQWLDCSNNYAIIPGATNLQFTPAINGTYSLEVSLNGCVDTSDCQTISTIGLDNLSSSYAIRFYPNPVTNSLKVESGDGVINSIQMIDLMGKVVLKEAVNEEEILLDLSDLNTGVYMLRIYTDSFVDIQYIVKQ